MFLGWSQNLAGGGGAGCFEVGPEPKGGAWVFLGWSQSRGRSLDVPRVEPEPGLTKGPSLPGSTMRA